MVKPWIKFFLDRIKGFKERVVREAPEIPLFYKVFRIWDQAALLKAIVFCAWILSFTEKWFYNFSFSRAIFAAIYQILMWSFLWNVVFCGLLGGTVDAVDLESISLSWSAGSSPAAGYHTYTFELFGVDPRFQDKGLSLENQVFLAPIFYFSIDYPVLLFVTHMSFRLLMSILVRYHNYQYGDFHALCKKYGDKNNKK